MSIDNATCAMGMIKSSRSACKGISEGGSCNCDPSVVVIYFGVCKFVTVHFAVEQIQLVEPQGIFCLLVEIYSTWSAIENYGSYNHF